MLAPCRSVPYAALCAAFIAAGIASCRLDKVGTGELVAASDDAGPDAADEPPAPDAELQDTGGTGGSGGSSDASEEQEAAAEAEACVPVTCQQLQATCGHPSDGCGQPLSCGDCQGEQGCHDGRCVVVRYVVPLGAGTQDGSSWDNALPSVQAGVDEAQPGDEIWVGQGTYYRTTPGLPVVTLKPGVLLYGGFAGTEEDRSARDLSSSPSTLDGANANRVVQGANDALIDGFQIRAGWVGDSGGGMSLVAVQGMKVANCKFQQNYAGVHGAGLYALNSSVTVTHSEFEGNNARQGAGFFNDHSTVTLDGCVFYANKADANSGGGGALFNYDGPTTVTNTVFYRNVSTPYFGGAVYNLGTQAFRFVNCTFHENTADQSGGAIFDNLGAKPVLINCILWGNSPDQLYDWSGSGPPDISYSDVQGADGGTGNISSPPGFEDPLSGKLGLSPGSPCIDSADGTNAPPVDALGSARADDPATPNTGVGSPSYADMGAYEYQP